MGTELQFRMLKFWRWFVVMVVQHFELLFIILLMTLDCIVNC